MDYQEAVDVLWAWAGRPVIVATSARRRRRGAPRARKGVWRRRTRRHARRRTFGLDAPGGRATLWTVDVDASRFLEAQEHADRRGLTVRASDSTLFVLLDDIEPAAFTRP